MSFLTPHVSHRRSKSNFIKLASTQEQESAEVFEDDKQDETSPELFLVRQRCAQRRADPLANETFQPNLLPTQSSRDSITQPQPFFGLLYSRDVSNTASILSDHDYEVAEACRPSSSAVPLTPSATISSGHRSSSLSATTPVFRPIQKPSIVPNLDHFAKRRRKSSTDIEKGIDAATESLGKVVDDMAASTPRIRTCLQWKKD